MSVRDFIGTIIGETNGFVIDEPWRLSEDSLGVIVPVVRNKRTKRGYITLAEAKAVDIEDTGKIDAVKVTNKGSEHLYVSRGEIFKGDTQERAAIHGYMIAPNSSLNVAVRCIHHSKGINPGSKMSYGGKTPYMVNLDSQQNAWNTVHMYSDTFGNHMPGHGMSHLNANGNDVRIRTPFPNAISGAAIPSVMYSSSGMRSSNLTHNADVKTSFDSGASFTSANTNAPRASMDSMEETLDLNQVNGTLNAPAEPTHLGADMPASDDLVGSLGNMTDKLKEALKKIPPIKNQVGAIFLEDNKILGLDVYDMHLSWSAIKDDVIKKEGSTFIKKETDNIFEFKADKVKSFLGKRLDGVYNEKTIFDGNGYKVVEIREEKSDKQAPGLRGEAVIFKDKVIHLSMFRTHAPTYY